MRCFIYPKAYYSVILAVVFGICICISFIRKPKTEEELQQDLEDQDKALKDCFEGKFKVVDIYSDRIVVYSNAEQRRYTFKIGGEEK